MLDFGAYLLGVVAAALLCAVVAALFPGNGLLSGGIRIITGMFMILTVISPLTQLQGEPIWDLTEGFIAQGQSAAEEGTDFARQTLAAGIKQRTEEYILDKAASFGAVLRVEVRLTEDTIPAPAAVTMEGNIAPYAKLRLEKIIEEDLGIPQKEQLWTGTN